MNEHTKVEQCPFCAKLQAEVERLRELRDGDQEEIERLMREIRMTEDTKTTNQ